MNTSQQLVQLSGMAGVSAGQHLYAIGQSGLTAGDILVSRSSLLSAAAQQHLMDSGLPSSGVTLYIDLARRRGRR